MNPGYKTTEFWLTLIVTVLSTAVTLGIVPTDGNVGKLASLFLSVAAAYGYTYSRTQVKVANAKVGS